MVVGFGAGVVPSTTSNARGALLWVFGARGDIGAVLVHDTRGPHFGKACPKSQALRKNESA